jgi:hypothetical protein
VRPRREFCERCKIGASTQMMKAFLASPDRLDRRAADPSRLFVAYYNQIRPYGRPDADHRGRRSMPGARPVHPDRRSRSGRMRSSEAVGDQWPLDDTAKCMTTSTGLQGVGRI